MSPNPTRAYHHRKTKSAFPEGVCVCCRLLLVCPPAGLVGVPVAQKGSRRDMHVRCTMSRGLLSTVPGQSLFSASPRTCTPQQVCWLSLVSLAVHTRGLELPNLVCKRVAGAAVYMRGLQQRSCNSDRLLPPPPITPHMSSISVPQTHRPAKATIHAPALHQNNCTVRDTIIP